MSVAEQANLVVAISLRDQFTPSVRKLQTNLKTLDMQTAQLRRGLGKIGQGLKKGIERSAVLAAAAVGLLATQVKAGITEILEWEDATLQVEAAIKSTNGAAKVNVELTQELAEKYAALSLAEDDVILASQSLLLRFPRITKDAFEPALAASLDLSQAMGVALPQATRTVGRALNDPIKGLSRLERVGVSFTEQEKKKIQRLQQSGRTLEAQRLILQKLNRVYGGSATQATVGYRGKVKLLTDRIKDLQQALAAPLLEPLTRVTEELTKFAASEEVKQGITDLGEGIASLFTSENIQTGIDAIKDGFGFLRDLPWDSIKQGLQTTADIAARAVGLFKSLPPEVQGGLVTLLAANKLTGGLVASGLGDIATFVLRNLTTINAAVVNVVGAKVNAPGADTDSPLPSPPVKGDLFGALGMLGRQLPIIGMAFEAQDRGKELLRKQAIVRARLDRQFRSGFVTGLAGMVPGLRAENTPRQQAADRFNSIQALVRAIAGSGPQASPGGGGQRVQMQVIEKLSTLATLGDKQNEQAANIWERLGQGNITYQEANKRLNALLQENKDQTAAIRAQEMRVNLQPYIQISASQTGNAITLAATGSRIVIR